MQPAGSPATSATPSAASPTQDGATAAPAVTPSALAALGEIVTGQGAPPPAILLSRPPPVRRIEIAALIAIVALADLALYQGGGGGAGLAVLFVGVPAIVWFASEPRMRSPRLAAIAAILALIAARCLWQSSAGAIALGMAMLLAFAIALRISRSFLPELAASALGSVWGALRQLGRFGAAVARLTRPARSLRAGWAAIAIPAALVIVFGAIFAAANPVIQGWLGSAIDRVSGAGWPSPVRFVFWAGCAAAAAALLRPAIRSIAGLDARLGAAHVSEPGDEVPASSRLALARNGMIALNALFLGYNALDAVYLWGGHAPSGITHTEYAHTGTVWLTVAFVLSTIVLGALFRGPIEHHARGRLSRGLAHAWAAQNFLLAAGTFRRITIYIAYSGLTQLRIVGIFGTTLATLGLAIVVYKVARRRTMLWVMRRQLDALAVAVAVFIVAPTDELAMRYNAARIAADQYRPLLHLYEQPLRPEAVPALLALLDHPDPVVREGVAVIAAAQRDRLRADNARAGWLDFELSRHRALGALDEAAARLAEVMPRDPQLATARLRGVAYGINDEVERAGDEGPFDWRARRYAPRDH